MSRKLKKATETATETTATSNAAAAIAASVQTDRLAFTVDRKELAAVLRKLAPICPKGKRSLPVLGNVAITASKFGVTMATTDLDVYAVQNAPAWHVHGTGSVLVNAKALSEIVGKLADGPITLRVAQLATLALEITSGTATVALQAGHARDYPKLPKVLPDDPALALTRINADTFGSLLASVEHAISRDETRFHLNGICVEYDGDRARMIATDGHRLALAQSALSRSGDFTADRLIVPERACKLIGKAIKRAGTFEIGMVGLASTSAKMLAVRVGGFTLVAKCTEAQFPQYWQVIPKDHKRLVTVDREALIATVKRMAPMCSDTRGVSLKLFSGSIDLAASHPDMGDARETLEAETDPRCLDVVTIGVNPRYMLDALASVTGERVTLAFGGELDPVLVRSTEDATTRAVVDASVLVVVMPMRI